MAHGGKYYSAIRMHEDEQEEATRDYVDQMIECMFAFFVVRGPCPERQENEPRGEHQQMLLMWDEAVAKQDDRRRLFWDVDPCCVKQVLV